MTSTEQKNLVLRERVASLFRRPAAVLVAGALAFSLGAGITSALPASAEKPNAAQGRTTDRSAGSEAANNGIVEFPQGTVELPAPVNKVGSVKQVSSKSPAVVTRVSPKANSGGNKVDSGSKTSSGAVPTVEVTMALAVNNVAAAAPAPNKVEPAPVVVVKEVVHTSSQPFAPAPTKLFQTISMYAENPQGMIVQWDGDPKARKTSWLVGADRRRRLIPDSTTLNCLQSRGASFAGPLPGVVINSMPEVRGVYVTCNPIAPGKAAPFANKPNAITPVPAAPVPAIPESPNTQTVAQKVQAAPVGELASAPAAGSASGQPRPEDAVAPTPASATPATTVSPTTTTAVAETVQPTNAAGSETPTDYSLSDAA